MHSSPEHFPHAKAQRRTAVRRGERILCDSDAGQGLGPAGGPAGIVGTLAGGNGPPCPVDTAPGTEGDCGGNSPIAIGDMSKEEDEAFGC